MQTMIYDSDAFCVFQLDWADRVMEKRSESSDTERHGGFEIVDKFARKEIFIDGPVADGFRERVQNLMANSPTTDDIDEFLDGFSALSRQNLHAH
ncbi:DUF3567 family protein [Thiomonas sp. FB-Cd]|uniref:BTH_I0359 family protein n=1 Tax=Thiomonas sp. FB-Cd TaxID=1158292 RepID=UPI0004DF55E8|nr:DUF3567 family protein [Thiomonas sp. FB-Cd]